jgi:mannosidase alpha-like ER degradation enhancer 2
MKGRLYLFLAAVLAGGAAGACRQASTRTAALSASTPPPPASIDRAALAARVREELLHAWRGYERHAWGHDELRPVSRTAHDWHAEPLLMTPVDSLDTLILMGLRQEAEKAKALILEKLSFDKDVSVKNFEITIRILGGLLSGFQMTGDLLFAPEETLDLERVVFNTEAHPLRRTW